MAEYDLELSRQMSLASRLLLSSGAPGPARDRAAIYIALVACEIALKAGLEKAGMPVAKIRKHQHGLANLLAEFSRCEISVAGQRQPATRIRAIVVDPAFKDATIGHLIEAEKYGASKFPTEIRYGDVVNHFPAGVMTALSEQLVDWMECHINDIRLV